MSDPVLIALITAFPATLGLLGAGIWKVVNLTVDAYKERSNATLESKNSELSTKDQVIDSQQQLIDKLERRVERQDDRIDQHLATIADLRGMLRTRGGTA